MKRLEQHPWLRIFCLLVRRYVNHHVGIYSAALAFYLLFTLFPFLIFVSALLGVLELDVVEILLALREILPAEVVEVVRMYLQHVAENPNPRLVLFGLVFSIYFPMRATRTLMRSVRLAYHLGAPENPIRHLAKSFLFAGMLLVVIAGMLVMMTVGERLLYHVGRHVFLPAWVNRGWVLLRFPAAAVAGGFLLLSLYEMAQDRHRTWKQLWPGTAAALVSWLALSWAYAYYVDHVAHYSALYGSIGTIIVLLVWLNFSAKALILGAELNGTILSLHKENIKWIQGSKKEQKG